VEGHLLPSTVLDQKLALRASQSRDHGLGKANDNRPKACQIRRVNSQEKIKKLAMYIIHAALGM
jgi:hypothetical protein